RRGQPGTGAPGLPRGRQRPVAGLARGRLAGDPRLRQPVRVAGRHPARGPERGGAGGGPLLRIGPPRAPDHPQQGRPAPRASAIPAPEEAARAAHADDLSAVVELAAEAAAEKREQKGGALWWRRERRPGDPATDLAAMLASADHEVAVGTLDGTVI